MIKAREVGKIALEWLTLVAGVVFCIFMGINTHFTKIFLIAGIVSGAYLLYNILTFKRKTILDNHLIETSILEEIEKYTKKDMEEIKKGRSSNIYRHCKTLQDLLVYYNPNSKTLGLTGELMIPKINTQLYNLNKQMKSLFGNNFKKIETTVNNEKTDEVNIYYKDFIITITPEKIKIKENGQDIDLKSFKNKVKQTVN